MQAIAASINKMFLELTINQTSFYSILRCASLNV